jgi:UDP:flavonoid glycosyltransferase YjiC (YdhE family)
MRIVLNTFGSLGDLNPYLALAIALHKRGHEAVVATSEVYRQKVQAEGVEFAPVRPDVGELLNQPELTAKLWHPRQGSEFLIRDYILPQLEDSYQDSLKASTGADLVLTHIAGYAAPIAAEVMGIRWISLVLQPMVMFSAYDPPVIPNAAWLRHLYRFGPGMFRALMRGAEFQLNKWAEPIVRLRTKVGLKTKANPLLGGQFSPCGTILLFSRYFAPPQPDWPTGWRQTGFIFYDRQGQFGKIMDSASRLSDELEHFLAAGDPPVLFTLGSSAVTHPGTFFRESMAAALKAGQRAVLLTGPLAQDELAQSIPESIFVASYLPYSQIMPRASAIVHQGGVGTTAQAMRAGRPMLVVPWSHDQPDNAARLTKLGVAQTVPRNRYKAARVAKELSRLLGDDGYGNRARELGKKITAEDGLTAAVDAIEEMASRAWDPK